MEIVAPGIVLSVRAFGEGDAVAAVFTEAHGIWRGLARGAQARRGAALWQPGNLGEFRWVARLSDQLGSFSGELVFATAAQAMSDPWALGVLTAGCAVAEAALPEREPHPAVFRGLLHLVTHATDGAAALPDLVRWELGLLAALGYGLDLQSCALTGARTGLGYVSPKTGRAVTAAAAGLWKERLLALPAFLAGGEADALGAAEGLRLSGYFLRKSALGVQHRGVPEARERLERMAWERVGQGREGGPA